MEDFGVRKHLHIFVVLNVTSDWIYLELRRRKNRSTVPTLDRLIFIR